jgi:hypothetical protein
MAEMSDYLEKKILDYVLRNTADWAPTAVYLALHTADPVDAGSGAEVSGGSYARQACAFDATHATGGNTANTDAESFTVMPACTVTHIGVWDAASSGNLLFHTAVDTSKAVLSGDTISVAAGAVTITLA